MKNNKKKLQEKLWKLCCEYIRLRDKNTCQWCGKRVEGSNAHTSHVIPKSHGNALRYDENNLKLLCFHCHLMRWHLHPLEADLWFQKCFPERYEYLMNFKEKTLKLTPSLIEEMINDYKFKILNLNKKENMYDGIDNYFKAHLKEKQ